jgi:undecaprenyl phosphate-alpha-L-ara4N flippase subunit ArnE
MTIANFFICILCAAAVTAGQILMKVAGNSWGEANTFFNYRTMFWTFLAFSIYAGSSVVWLYVLRQIPLSQAYPLMSLTFLLVPIASAIVFSETYSWINVVSSLVIMFGISINAISRHSMQ